MINPRFLLYVLKRILHLPVNHCKPSCTPSHSCFPEYLLRALRARDKTSSFLRLCARKIKRLFVKSRAAVPPGFGWIACALGRRDLRAAAGLLIALAALFALPLQAQAQTTITITAGGDVKEKRPAVFTLTRTGDPAHALTVTVTVDDDATNAVLGETVPTTVSFGAGQATASLSLPTIDIDAAATPQVTVTVASGTGYAVGSPASARVRVAGGICGRTQQVRSAILGKITGVSDCAAVADDDARLADITGTLDLQHSGITALDAKDFGGLTALSQLYLSGNSLTSLPAGVFDGLAALSRLLLNSNNLASLPAGVFDGLTALSQLYLNSNDLASLPADVFDGLTTLWQLQLDGNDLASLPAGVFDGLKNLLVLRLNDNFLASLPAGVFDQLTKLQVLGLDGNSLVSLSDGVFANLGNLTMLNLSGNPGSSGFVPAAEAGPNQGIPTWGGVLILNASAPLSANPWGSNVTYGWALTDPASGVTVNLRYDSFFDHTVASIPALTAGTVLTFTLTVTGKGTTSRTATDTMTVTVGQTISQDTTLTTTENKGPRTPTLTTPIPTTPTPRTPAPTTPTVPSPPTSAHLLPPPTEAGKIDTNDELREFVEDAAERIKASDAFEGTLNLLERFRDREGDWNDGSTYLVLLTKRGGVYFHANRREVEDLDWSGALFCEGGGSVLDLDVGQGCLMDSGSSYAHRFSASHVPLAHGEDEFILLGGFNEIPEGEPFTGVIDGPSTEAGDVDTDDELKGFVGDAARALGEALRNQVDPAQFRGVLRQGQWMEGDVYVYIMDETGRVIFDGQDRSREQKRTDEPGKLYVIDRIANAGEEAVGHVVGDFWIYAVKVEIPLDGGGEESRVYVVGSEYRVEETPPGGSGNGGGGCTVGGSDSTSAFGLLLAALALLLTVFLKKHSSQDKTR